MIHHLRLKPPRHDYPENEWNLIEKAFHPEFIAQTEAIFALGNGYIGMRGTHEEGTPCVQNGTFVNGFYESWPLVYPEEAFGLARTGQTMLNVTDSKTIKLFVDDEPFSIASATLCNYERKLNMKAGTLDRDILWETPSGTQVQIRSRRLISFRQRHAAAIRYEVTVLNSSARVVISSEMQVPRSRQQETQDDPRKSKFSNDVLRHRGGYVKERRIVLIHSTQRTAMILACAMDHELQTDCPHYYRTEQNEDFGQVALTVHAQPGRSILLTKYISYHTSAAATPRELGQRAEWTLDGMLDQGFMKLLSEQAEYLDLFWRRSDVRVSNVKQASDDKTVEVQQAIRINLFHILQASARAENTGVPAKGLTGQAYEGHYFWDTEIYLLPFLIYTSPQIAKNVLLFRYNILDKARQRAKELSQKGALFPWRTINGEEASAYYEAGTAQYHINADIAFALRKYVNATGDEEFLSRYGAEILIETARLWYDLGFFSNSKGGQFCINGVTGPDEYKTVVNNNTYTNLMARENLRYAIETIEAFRHGKPETLQRLIEKTGLDLSEIEDWRRAADKMYIPFDPTTGIYPQDDSFLDRKRWDFKNTPRDRYPLLLYYHPLNIYRHQVIKQADVVLAMLLLGNQFSLEAKKRNFAFYDPLTTGDSSLSSCIEAVVALEVGKYDKAVAYMRAALLMDLADVGGNVKDGCHIASMGGTWMALVYGFGGMRDYDGTLSFAPHRPPQTESLKFALTWRGQLLDVEIDHNSTTYLLREGEALTIRHLDEVITLTQGDPRISRPTLRPGARPPSTSPNEGLGKAG